MVVSEVFASMKAMSPNATHDRQATAAGVEGDPWS